MLSKYTSLGLWCIFDDTLLQKIVLCSCYMNPSQKTLYPNYSFYWTRTHCSKILFGSKHWTLIQFLMNSQWLFQQVIHQGQQSPTSKLPTTSSLLYVNLITIYSLAPSVLNSQTKLQNSIHSFNSITQNPINSRQKFKYLDNKISRNNCFILSIMQRKISTNIEKLLFCNKRLQTKPLLSGFNNTNTGSVAILYHLFAVQ